MKKPFNFYLNSIICLTLLFSLISFQSFSQKIDQERLNRDIEIAQSILYKLFAIENESSNEIFYGSRIKRSGNIFIASPREGGKGYYVNGQGVVLQVVHRPEKVWSVNDNQGNKVIENVVPNTFEKDKVVDLLKEFLLKYADLIGQLKPDDKIIIVFEEEQDEDFAPIISGQNNGRLTLTRLNKKDNKETLKITAEIDRQSVSNLKSGQMSEENFLNKITIHESKVESKDAFDFEVLSGILETLFRNDEYLHLDEDVDYNYIEGFGVNYYLHLYPVQGKSIINLDGVAYPTATRGRGRLLRFYTESIDENNTNLSAKKQKELDELKVKMDSLDKVESEKIKVALKDLEPKLKEYIIEYGRTLKTLKPDEVLVLNVSINRWRNPFDEDESDEKSVMQLSVKQSVLAAYDNRESTLEQAMSQVEISK